MLKFGPFSGHFDYLARIRVLARNFGSTGSSAYKGRYFASASIILVMPLLMHTLYSFFLLENDPQYW